jgi:hypothetical protein
MRWHNQERNECYAVIAEKIKGKEKLRERGIHVCELADIEAVKNTTTFQ